MNNESLELLDILCELLVLPDEDDVREYLLQVVPELKQDMNGNLYNIKPNTPCMVAHMDNVGKEASHKNLHTLCFKTENYAEGEPNGRLIINASTVSNKRETTYNIGADDKCGIAAALYLYKKFDKKISLIFTSKEEVGGVGAKAFSKNFSEELETLLYCIEIDRRGCTDIIATKNDYCTQEFLDAIQVCLPGYTEENGTYTDVKEFAPYVNSINLSAGYYHAHSDSEYIVFDELANTVAGVERIFNTVKTRMAPPVIRIPEPTYFPPYNGAFANTGYLGNNTKYTPSIWSLPLTSQKLQKNFFLVDYKQKRIFEFDIDTCLHMFFDGKAAQAQLHKL